MILADIIMIIYDSSGYYNDDIMILVDIITMIYDFSGYYNDDI